MAGRINFDYDKKDLIQDLVVIAVVMALMYGTGGAGFVVVVPLMLLSVIRVRPDKTFFWLMLTVSTLIGNGYLFPKDMIYGVSQRVMMCVLGGLMTLKVFGGRKSHILAPFLLMLFYALYMIVPSTIGWCPVISYLKLFLFTVTYFAYVGIAKMVGESRSDVTKKVRSAILAFAILFLVGSIVLIPFPGISQLSGEEYEEAMRNGVELNSLFKGMTTHSQALGPLVAMLNVILLADMLFSIKRFDRLYCVLLLCCPYLIYKTSSRTGMGTYLLSSMYVVYLMMKARGVGGRWRGKALSAIMMIVSVVMIAILAMPSSREGIQNFILKDKRATQDLSLNTVVSTRSGLVEVALENFKESPLFGNGFQVSREMRGITFSSMKSILSAPIEKGVWYAAVLEEGGIIGFGIFVIVLCVLIFKTPKYGGYTTSACMVAITLSNLGEFTFFSMSYTGGMAWALVFTGVILDTLRQRSQQQERMMGYAIR